VSYRDGEDGLNIPGLMSPPVRKTETVIPDKKKLQIPDFGNRLDL